MNDWEDEGLDLLLEYEIAKSDDLMEIEEFIPYVNTNRFIEKLIEDLCQRSKSYKIEKTIQEIKSYLQETNRLEDFFYSDINNYIYKLGLMEKKNLNNNIKVLLMYILSDKNNVDKNIKLIVMKIYDYINLNKVQNQNIKNILEESVASVKEKLHTEIKTIEREYITILGIFASIVLSFVGGMTFTTSVLQNIEKVGIFRLALIIEVLGFILMNLIYILISFILEINNINKRKYDKYIKCVNRVLLGMACLTGLSWFFNFIEFKEYISRYFYWSIK